jgi:TRAP-type mannitol/chloroaromatic compound transport system substrate-binding protein
MRAAQSAAKLQTSEWYRRPGYINTVGTAMGKKYRVGGRGEESGREVECKNVDLAGREIYVLNVLPH